MSHFHWNVISINHWRIGINIIPKWKYRIKTFGMFTCLFTFVGEGMWFSHRKWLHQIGSSRGGGAEWSGKRREWGCKIYIWFSICMKAIQLCLLVTIVGVFQLYFPSILYLYLVCVIFFLLYTKSRIETKPNRIESYRTVPFMWLGIIISSHDVFHIIYESIFNTFASCKYIDCVNMFGYFMLWILHFFGILQSLMAVMVLWCDVVWW